MRDASDCQAINPRTCPYHGSVITMNEALERMNHGGATDPADLDLYFVSRKKVESAEEEFQRQQWMAEMRGSVVDKPLLEAPATEPVLAAKKPYSKGNSRRPASSNRKPANEAATQSRSYTGRNNRKPATPRQPLVPSHASYAENLFPIQAQLTDENNKPVILTRHDKAVGTPKGIMLGVSRPLSSAEREHLIGLLQYQHTVSSRDEEGKAKTVAPEDVNRDHSGRSVYLKTQFKADGSQLKTFHAGLNKILQEGSVPRQNGTRKFEPFAEDAQVVVYYNS